ncbi:hypothetical protein [Bradyrhizobium australiense]|uniref:Uncharacterized protein n=1 Tax=Bradyrhizobium australiense TaxID=2721161 RepID=A0A7Y4LW98_9BRAD|nr:hypothetical protein [Bradyrhizobium australiense]NOJ40966.1 hypothetical protein [Bradyrhizobium australiense]
MPPSRTVIASPALLAVDRKGPEFKITIAVGEPYQSRTPSGPVRRQWKGCTVASPTSTAPAPDRRHKLAHQIIAQMLAYFVKDGGKLFDPEERKPVTPEELFPKLALCG